MIFNIFPELAYIEVVNEPLVVAVLPAASVLARA